MTIWLVLSIKYELEDYFAFSSREAAEAFVAESDCQDQLSIESLEVDAESGKGLRLCHRASLRIRGIAGLPAKDGRPERPPDPAGAIYVSDEPDDLVACGPGELVEKADDFWGTIQFFSPVSAEHARAEAERIWEGMRATGLNREGEAR